MFSPASQIKAKHSDKMQGQGPASTPYYFENANHPELERKVKTASDKFSENLQVIANEPSLAFFRIQEHVRKTLPQLAERKHEVQDLQRQVQGSCFDTEYAINAVKTMETSSVHFQNMQDLLKNSMFMKQQLQYEQSRRAQEKARPSMYRSMLRTHTVDIPSAVQDPSHFTGSMQLPTSPEPVEGPPRARSSSLTHSSSSAAAAAARQAHALR